MRCCLSTLAGLCLWIFYRPTLHYVWIFYKGHIEILTRQEDSSVSSIKMPNISIKLHFHSWELRLALSSTPWSTGGLDWFHSWPHVTPADVRPEQKPPKFLFEQSSMFISRVYLWRPPEVFDMRSYHLINRGVFFFSSSSVSLSLFQNFSRLHPSPVFDRVWCSARNACL